MKRSIFAIAMAIGCWAVFTAEAATAQPIRQLPRSAGPACGSSFNPYDYTQAELSACRIATFPLSRITRLPGGGESYHYRLGNGVTVQLLMPPAGFNPLTATKAQLSEYQFPPRPANHAARKTWDAHQANMHVASPPRFLANVPGGQFTYSYPGSYWSGWGVATDSKVVKNVTVQWNEPTVGYYCNNNDAEGQWAGLGDFDPSTWPDTTHKLAQDGTAEHFAGLDNGQAWFTVLPAFSSAKALSVVAAPGDHVSAYVDWNASETWFDGNVQDTTNNEQMGWIAQVPSSDYQGDSAEAIVERPLGSDQLSHFGTINFTNADFNGNTSFTNTSWPTDKIHLTDDGTANGNLLATIGSLGQNGSFEETWAACK